MVAEVFAIEIGLEVGSFLLAIIGGVYTAAKHRGERQRQKEREGMSEALLESEHRRHVDSMETAEEVSHGPAFLPLPMTEVQEKLHLFSEALHGAGEDHMPTLEEEYALLLEEEDY